MADSARKFDPNENEDAHSAIRPNLRAIDGGGEGNGVPSGRLAPVPDSPDESDDSSASAKSGRHLHMVPDADETNLPNSEQEGIRPEKTKPERDEAKAAGVGDDKTIGEGYRDEGTQSPKRLRLNRKQKAGVVASGIVAVTAVALFGIFQSPFELIHYSQILKKNFTHQENASGSRLGKMYRWVKSGDIKETRLSWWGSRQFNKTRANLAKSGIELNSDKFVGQLTTISIDTSKHPTYQGLPDDQARAAIAADNGITPDKIAKISGLGGERGSKFAFNIRDASISAKRAAIRLHVDSLGLGEIKSGLQFRRYTRVYNAPSWLRPLQRIGTNIDLRLSNRIQGNRLSRALEERRAKKLASRTPEAIARANALKGKLKIGTGVVGGVLLGTTAVCVAKDIASQIPEINKENIVDPAVKSGVDAVAIGEQTASGQVPDFNQVGAIKQGLRNADGKTVWDSKPVRSLQGVPGGEDIDPDIKQAFSPASNAANIETGLDEIGAEEMCSSAGQLFSAVAGVALLFVPGPGWVAKGLTTAGGIAAITAISTIVPKLLADEPLTGIPHQGPKGGSVDAYGIREAANVAFRGSGGSELSASQTLVLEKQAEEDYRKEFQSKSFAARMFDPYDHRSLASHIIDSQSTNPTQNLANLTNGLTTGAWLSNLSSVFFPKASAAEEPYDYGFPRYGFSQNDLDNSIVDNPFENGEKVAQMLNNPALYEGIKSRARTCFGVEILRDANTNLWDVQLRDGVNPATSEYIESNCADAGNEDWLRVRFFVFDTAVMTSYACYEGDEEACTALGYSNAATTTTTTGLTSGAAKGQDTSSQTCKIGQDAGIGDTPEPSIKIRLCKIENTIVNVALESNVKTIFEEGGKAGFSFGGSGYRSNAQQIALRERNGCGGSRIYDKSCKGSPETAVPAKQGVSDGSMHEWGLAVDFNCNGTKIPSKSSPCFKWFEENQALHKLLNLPSEAWHWSSNGH